MFTKEEYVDWRAGKVTKDLIKELATNRQLRLDEVAEGKVEGNELYRELGRIQGIKDCVNFLLNLEGELTPLFIEEDDGTKV